jgi:predicted Zn-dependent protease
MPQSLKKMKLAFTMRLGSAQAIGVDERLRAADEYRQFYPNDASIDLIALDALLLRKSYNQALAGLDRIDTAVGGDPYLKVLRARILLKQDKPEAARKMAEAGIAEEPTLKAAYYFLVDQSLKQRNFAKSAELLSQLESRCNVKFMDLTTVPAYAEFVKSQEYKAWLKSRRGGK